MSGTRKRKGSQDILAIYFSTMEAEEETETDDSVSPAILAIEPTAKKKKRKNEKTSTKKKTNSDITALQGFDTDIQTEDEKITATAGLDTLTEEIMARMAAHVWRSRVWRSWQRVDPAYHSCAGKGVHITKSILGAGANAVSTEKIRDVFADQKIKEYKVTQKKPTTSVLLEAGRNRGCEMQRVRTRLYRTEGDIMHLCVEGACNMASKAYGHGQWQLQRTLDDLYICKRTGIPHLCGPYCDSTGTFNEESIRVCPITAITLHESDMRSANWYEYGSGGGTGTTFGKANTGYGLSGRVHNPLNDRPQSVRQQNAELRAEDSRSFEELMYDNSYMNAFQENDNDTRRKKKPSASNGWVVTNEDAGEVLQAKDYWFREISRKLFILFSWDRMNMELRENAKLDEKTYERIRSYLYKTHVNDEPAYADDLSGIIAMEHTDTYCFPKVSMSTDMLRKISFYFARRCMKLWYVLVNRTALGRQRKDKMGLDNFVEAAMHTFQSGIYVSEVDSELPCHIVPESGILKHIRVNTCVATCFLNYGNLPPDKLDERIRSHNNKTCNSIRKLIQTAFLTEVSTGNSSPEHLKPDSIEYEIMDNATFQVGRKGKKHIRPQHTTVQRYGPDVITSASVAQAGAMVLRNNNSIQQENNSYFPSLAESDNREHLKTAMAVDTEIENAIYDSPVFSRLNNPSLLFSQL